jgi:hypothetical protein
MPSTPSNDANGPQTHKRNISKANGKEMFVNTRTPHRRNHKLIPSAATSISSSSALARLVSVPQRD